MKFVKMYVKVLAIIAMLLITAGTVVVGLAVAAKALGMHQDVGIVFGLVAVIASIPIAGFLSEN